MLKKLLLLCTLLSGLVLTAQVPALDWAYAFGGPSNDAIWASELDAQGNIYNVGYFNDTVDFDQGPGVSLGMSAPNTPGMFLQKIHSNGTLAWVKTWTSSDYIGGASIDIGPTGSIYIGGSFGAPTMDLDPSPSGVFNVSRGNYTGAQFIIKLDRNGNFKKGVAQSGASLGFQDIQHDRTGSIYVLGNFSTPCDGNPHPSQTSTLNPKISGQHDFFVQKLDTNLNQSWIKVVYGTGVNKANALIVNKANEPVIAGEYEGPTAFNSSLPLSTTAASAGGNGFILRLGATGNFVGVLTSGGAGKAKYTEMQIDRHGYMYLAGSYSGNADLMPGNGTALPVTSTSEGWFLGKLNPNFGKAWFYPYETSLQTEQTRPLSLAIDNEKNVYCGGYYWYSTINLEPGLSNGLVLARSGARDIFIAKHDSTGTLKWGRGFGSNQADRALSVLVDNNNSLFLSGYYSGNITFDPYSIGTRNTNGGYDCYILKFGKCAPPLDTAMAITACNYYKHNGIRYYSDTLLVDTLISYGGCDSAIEKRYVTFYNLPLTVNQSPGMLSWVPSSGGNYTYAWYNCTTDSLVAGANLSFLKPQTNGTYALILSDGFCTDTSACFTLNDVSLVELNPLEYLTIYPNPVNEVLYISGAQDEVYDLTLLDISGRKVLEVKKATSVDVSHLPVGTYFLRIEQGGFMVVKKVVIP